MYFVLGDNSKASTDSRDFGAIASDMVAGRPFLVFYPFSRIRFM